MRKVLLVILLLPYIVNAQKGINLNGFGVELNQFGRIQIVDVYPGLNSIIYQSSILVATTDSTVFDFLQDAGNLDTLQSLGSSVYSDTSFYVAINNSYSNLPPAVIVKENLYAWKDSTFFLVKYTVINSDTIPVNALTGLEIVPHLASFYGYDTITYSFDKHYFSFFKNDKRVGMKYLLQDSTHISSLTSTNYRVNFANDSLYYLWLTHGLIDTTFYSDSIGAVTFTAHLPQMLAPGDSLSFFYAYTVASTDSAIQARLEQAEKKFRYIVVGINEPLASLPVSFDLYQNYPNPFNPSTIISFSLNSQERVRLNIYNILGERVSVLLDEVKSAGTYKVNFNAKNLSSGVYFYELSTDNMRISKKMMLIK